MSFIGSNDDLGTGFGNTNDAILPAEYLGEQHHQYDEDSVMDPPSQIQIPSTDVTCASSVTTHFQDADLFVPHMYPSAQNLDDTPDIPDPTFQPKQQTRETIEPSLPALKEEASVNPADNMTVEGTSAGSTVMDEKRLLKEQEKLSMAMPVGGPSVMNLEAKINQKTQIYSIQNTDTTEKNSKSNVHSSNNAESEKAFIISKFSAIGPGMMQNGDSANCYATSDPNNALEKQRNPIISDLLEPAIKDSENAVPTPPQQPTARPPIVPPYNNSGTVPGAHPIGRRIPQNGSQQAPLDSVDNTSNDDEEAQQRATHQQHSETLLAEATPVANTAENLPVATAAGEGNKKRFTDKENWQLHLMAVLLCLFILVGIIVGGVCGAGHCQSKVYVDSSSTMTTRDVVAAPQIEIVLTSLFGKDYFNEVEEAEFGTDTKLGEFLLETRQRAFDWIVNQDRLQLEYDAKNLVQRFLLVLFYYQTTRQHPWKECNPPQKGSSLAANFCYEFDFNTGEITSYIWGSLWLSDSHECDWAGVTCVTGQSNEEKRVTGLKIWWNGLSGPLPWEITQLQLKELDLRKSELTGTLPSKLLSNQNSLTLEGLFLVGGKLSGPIPKEWFLNQKEGNGNLKDLLLGGNRLTGTIPSELGLLSLEGRLGLNTNALTGTIPTEIFYSSSSLSNLWLHKNDLTGTVPTEVGLLTNMMSLTLYNTELSGSIPSEIGLASSLVELHISNTNLQGTLPEELFGGLTNLRYLIVNDCELSGAISSSIGLLNLYQLHIANNKFHGTIPDEIGELTALMKLQVNGNDLTGSVPISFCQGLFRLNTNQLEVVADCLPDVDTGIAEVDCVTGCCTSCCDENGICHAT